MRVRNLKASKNAILNGAERCFVEKGFEGASVSAIAREAKVTQSLIHYHFGRKEDLWDEVKRRRFDVCFSKQKDLLLQPMNEELIAQFVTSYFQVFEETPGLSRLMGWKAMEPDIRQEGQPETIENEIIRLAVERLQESQEKGFIRKDLNPSCIVVSMFSMITHWFNGKDRYFLQEGLDIGPTNADQMYLKNIIKILLGGIIVK